MNDLKFCKNCAHYKDITVICLSPNNGQSMITGNTKPELATFNRNDDARCGKGGAWFALKKHQPEKPWFNFW